MSKFDFDSAVVESMLREHCLTCFNLAAKTAADVKKKKKKTHTAAELMIASVKEKYSSA